MKVILAVDNNGFGQGLAELEHHRAWLGDAEIKVVTVIPSCMAYASMSVVPELLQEAMTESRKISRSVVREVALGLEKMFPASRIEALVMEGTPLDRLLELASEWPADLVVVGSHWRSAFSRIVLGSVAQSLIAKAPCSVLAVRLSFHHEETGGAKAGADLKAASVSGGL